MYIQELSKKLEDMFIFCDRDILINKHRIIGIDNNNLYLRDLDYTLKISARRLKEVKNVYFLEKKHEIIIWVFFLLFIYFMFNYNY